ncbi:MAG: hypothetical protein QME79_12015 [Bacillota bacterium]|nr:hypothetical protein [Bacillota bacterium]
MSVQLPLWYGQPRGTDLYDIVDFVDDEEQRGQFRLIDDVTAGIIGFLAPLVIIALAMTCAQADPLTMALLGIAGAAWFALGALSTCFVLFSREEDEPGAAKAWLAWLVVLGRIIAFVIVIGTVILGLFLLIALVMGSSDRR